MKQFVLIKDISTFNKHIYCSKDTENRNGAYFCKNRYDDDVIFIFIIIVVVAKSITETYEIRKHLYRIYGK